MLKRRNNTIAQSCSLNFLKKAGQFPNKERQAYFSELANYENGKFQNVIPTNPLLEGESMTKALIGMLNPDKDVFPRQPLPFVRTNLKTLAPHDDILVWFGHSSYFLQSKGLKILVDPVFSGNASPMPGSVKAFAGTNEYNAADMPEIDILFISHDHWDHLDYETVQQLQPKVKKLICGLGVAQHFEYWGWSKEKLVEKNWHESVWLNNDTVVTLTPARHFSGRLLKRNISLWTSFVLHSRGFKIFLGGDSGYGPHLKEIGEQHGPFDLAILECGQYNPKWPYIHTLPHQWIQVVKDLGAQTFLPVHHSKFKLALHAWYEPLQKATAFAAEENIPVITPRIGEMVYLDNLDKKWEKWWEPFISSTNKTNS